MTDAMKMIKLPARSVMLRRLKKVSNEQHVVNGLYPYILRHAGKDATAKGVVIIVKLAIRDYTQGFDRSLKAIIMELSEDIVKALVDDQEVRKEALRALRS
jgi:hypothetical protein